MPRIDLSSEDNLFPEFFQASESGDVNQLLHREPDWLVDLFYLRASETAPIILAALLGCSDGHLLLVIGEGMDKLSPLLRSKISDFQVSHRRKLRAIVGQEITIYTLYGVEQNVHTDGFNDALYLHARLDVKVVFDGENFRSKSMSREGWLTVGRLDTLFGCLKCFDYAFRPPYEDGKSILSLMVPTASIPVLQEGGGVGIVYAMTDLNGLRASGNGSILMRITYDVLLRLQQEMGEEQVDHPFVNATIPVPNRRRIEIELQGDGYEIRGNAAVRSAMPEKIDKATMLDHLRRLSSNLWTADRIALPPEASIQDYKMLIRSALEAAMKPTDADSFQRFSSWVMPEIIPDQTSPDSQQPHPKVVSSTKSISIPTKSSTSRESDAKRQAEWLEDFSTPIAKLERAVTQSSWSSDFEVPVEDERIVLDYSDWQSDFDSDVDPM